MTVSRFAMLLALAGGMLISAQARAIDLLAPGDKLVPIDLGPQTSTSTATLPPGGESPPQAIDGDVGTKYLNFGEEFSGFIVTPNIGSSVVQAIRFTTANDSDERDPMTFQIYGTNAPITSAANGSGELEPWSLIATGSTGLSTARQTPGPLVSFVNDVDFFTSYKILFPTVRNAALANSMQVSEVQMYQLPDGSLPILATGDPIRAIDILQFHSRSPGGEQVVNLLDGEAGTKYLNFGKENSGFIVTPNIAPLTIVDSFTITTANDADGRDPASFELYGTLDIVRSGDHSRGNAENWVLIDSGSLSLPLARGATSDPILVDNEAPYTSYRLVFPTLRNGPAVDSMQIANIQFQGSMVPEPSTWALATTAIVGLATFRRRRAKSGA